MELKNESSLTDEKIVEIAHIIDQLIVDIGERYEPAGIELLSIMMGRMVMFSKQVGCFENFHQLMGAVSKMIEQAPLAKTEDLQ